nr:DJ-1/PfpI family protein [Kibdelosporangium phytohabitans]
MTGRRIAILLESGYAEAELCYLERRFAEEGARVDFLTRLWGQRSLTFTGQESGLPFTVDTDVADVDDERLAGYDALVVPSGLVADRLRYNDDVDDPAPAVKLLRRAMGMKQVLKGISCHGMWLASPIADVVRGRRVTCHNNLVGDVRNMGARYTDQDVVVDDDLVTSRTAEHCHLFARTIIDLIAARAGERPFRAAPRQAQPVMAKAVERGFTFSDLVAGYVTAHHADRGLIDLRTSDGRTARVTLTSTTSAEFLRNLGDPHLDATTHLADLLVTGRLVFAYGIHYPDGSFDAKRLVFVGRAAGEYAAEEPDWWIRQVGELARFYRRAQFGDSVPVDYADYRTMLRLGGDKSDHHVQETDTISRLVYGMASSYLLTGNEDHLDVAERGTEYLRAHMRFVDRDNDVVYWYHGIDVRGCQEQKLFTSEFGDDYDAIPIYEQIFGLVGPTQTYRVTGDPRIAGDIDATLRLFGKFFRDREHGGFFSHIDPILLSPDHESLGPNRSRKNWHSIGEHAPAYLINLLLATGDRRHADMLEECFDLVAAHFPDPSNVWLRERFHADWRPDSRWGWQQDRAVVGHNLKVAWNLMRVNAIRPKQAYRALAERIGRAMPAVGADRQRLGWYDVIERALGEGQRTHRFVWHDRKAWWQQEQAILAYLILAANTGDKEFLRQARESSAFYNAFFLDHDEGGVYFNVLAAGTPYLLGNERLKGSHSMSMYHSAELCYLATVYGRLLVRGEPLSLWYRPRADGFRDRVLRVAPDALPAGRVRLDTVEIDGRPHAAFDPESMTVKLPDSSADLTVRVQLAPATGGTR